MTANPVTPEIEARMRDLRADGLTVKAIAERLGCSRGTVRYHLATRSPAPRSKSDRVDPSVRAEAIRRYVDGETIQALAKLLDVNSSTVNYWVTKAGVKRERPPAEELIGEELKRPQHLVDDQVEAEIFALRAEGLSILAISERVGFSVMTVSRRLSGLFGKARVRNDVKPPRFVTRPLELIRPSDAVLADVRARLARVMAVAGDRKRLPIASERAYCTLRELAIDANEVAPWLSAEQVAFAERLMEACQHYQEIHGLQMLRDAA